MCGIFGLVISKSHGLTPQSWEKSLEKLFVLSEARGKEAAGIAVARHNQILITKDSVSATQMLKTADYARTLRLSSAWFSDPSQGDHALAAIGHSRLVTNGMQGIGANNQPVSRDDVVLIHNGIVVNVNELWKREAAFGSKASADVDTEVIAAVFARYRREGDTPQTALSKVIHDVYGETSVAIFCTDLNAMLLGTNTGSLFVCRAPDDSALFFTSEKYMCEQLMNGEFAIPGFEKASITQIKPGQGAMVPLTQVGFELFDLNTNTASLSTPAISPLLGAQRRIEERSTRYRDAMAKMRRCTKCILPDTMPYIAFDADGVCNYCHNYSPWVKRPKADLEKEVAKYRSKNGSPDAIMAFSGGRDSSYGLHLIKKEYGFTPICFSYDWGMVTDLARRNQARMCGALGIEHIWISADIKMKRANIRKNVSAWLKKPDLGMIPLFMAGDKQFFWHANKMIQSTGIPLMVFCTNNLEKTDFKSGYIGIAPKDSQMRNAPSTMGIMSKAQLAWAYGSRFLANPRYINTSLIDTAFAAFSYYVQPQEHLFFFDYLPWDEDEINKTLIEGYGWELAPDSPSSWRIGDGTAPFYNYIYHTVSGFTEFDTFRSNQIREGQLTRERALALVEAENQPRWQSIREYCSLIQIDFDDAIRVIDNMPRAYMRD
jgi:glutamine---fructose-6-phosphate transaminase (isomerizing)